MTNRPHSCGGVLHPAEVDFDLGEREHHRVVLVVPGERCDSCRAEYISAEVATELDEIVLNGKPYGTFRFRMNPVSGSVDLQGSCSESTFQESKRSLGSVSPTTRWRFATT